MSAFDRPVELRPPMDHADLPPSDPCALLAKPPCCGKLENTASVGRGSEWDYAFTATYRAATKRSGAGCGLPSTRSNRMLKHGGWNPAITLITTSLMLFLDDVIK